MKNKVGIIYNGTKGADWAIEYFKTEFESKGMKVALFDANKLDEKYSKFQTSEDIHLPEIEKLTKQGHTTWMNRIYPSESEESIINKGLNITSWLSARNHTMINPLPACIADYNKAFAYEAMEKWNVPTPKTEIINKQMTAKSLKDSYGLPLIIKTNTGGKGLGVQKINNDSELENILENKSLFKGKHLVQEFAKPSKTYDVRVGVINGEALISYARTLATNGSSKEAWMGSCHHGSEIIPHNASEEEKRLAIMASKSLGAKLNEIDIQITEKGPVVIENNLTPGYDEGEERWIKLIVEHIYETHLKNE
jgi:RimK family alpha-L-glutamate ligase